MWLKFFFTALIVLECVLVIYIPSFVKMKLTKMKKKRLINLEVFENVASGAILTLAIVHLLPEAVEIGQNIEINIYLIFVIILSAITFLNVTDILYESGFQDESITDINVKSKLFEKKETDAEVYGDINEDGNEDVDVDVEMNRINKVENTRIQKIKVTSFSKKETQEQSDLENPISEEKTERTKNLKTNVFMDIARSNAFFITLSLVIHSFIEGMLLGGVNDTSTVVVAISYLAHKWAECLIIYKQVIDRVDNKYLSWIYPWMFILSLPAGLIIALFYLPSSDNVELIFTSVACGFFLYLSFNMTKDIKITERNKRYIAGSFFCGVVGMSALTLPLTYLEKQTIT